MTTSIAELAHHVRVTASSHGLRSARLLDEHAIGALDREPGAVLAAGNPHAVVVTSPTARAALSLHAGGAVAVQLSRQATPTYGDGLWHRTVEPGSMSAAGGVPPDLYVTVEALRLSVTLGLLDGFLTRAREVLLQHARPWHEAPVETADEDPHTQAVFGQAYATRSAIAALHHECLTALADVPADDDGHRLAAAADHVALARAYAGRRAGRVVSDVIGVLGASSATRSLGLDRSWRELRAFDQAFPPPLGSPHPWAPAVEDPDAPTPTSEGIPA